MFFAFSKAFHFFLISNSRNDITSKLMLVNLGKQQSFKNKGILDDITLKFLDSCQTSLFSILPSFTSIFYETYSVHFLS